MSDSHLKCEIVTLEGKTLPVKASWKKSDQLSMQEMHGLDLEEELLKFFFTEILMEAKDIGIKNIQSINFIR